MDALARDDVIHAIEQTLAFYGKQLDKVAIAFWLNAVRSHDIQDVKRALMDYPKVGKYAPKPVDILEILDANVAQKRAKLPSTPPPETSCPVHIRDAWMWFNNRLVEGSVLLDGLFSGSHHVDLDTQEEYLRTVNEQAKLYNQPDAIPDEFKLQEIWG